MSQQKASKKCWRVRSVPHNTKHVCLNAMQILSCYSLLPGRCVSTLFNLQSIRYAASQHRVRGYFRSDWNVGEQV